MASISELAVAKRPNFLLLGAHPAIDFANTLVPPPGPDIEFLQSWQDVIDWMKETKLSDGKKLRSQNQMRLKCSKECETCGMRGGLLSKKRSWPGMALDRSSSSSSTLFFVSIRLVKLCVSRVKEAFICIDRARCSKASIWLLRFSRGRWPSF